MSAREGALKKLRELYVTHQSSYVPWDKGCSWCDGRMILVEDILDTFAHELAEQIRNDGYDEWGNEDRFYNGVTMAADLIDPEVSDED